MAESAALVREAIKNVGHTLLGIAHSLGPKRDKWAEEAGLTWKIESAPLEFAYEGNQYLNESKRVLFRDDRVEILGVVSNRYRPVQPASVLEFFGDICDEHGFVMEMAGEAGGGRMLWGMAKTPHEIVLPGHDWVGNYLMLLTANDGTRATTGFFTAFRLRCTNQLPMLRRTTHGNGIARMSHSQEFTVAAMRSRVAALGDEWAEFGALLKNLHKTPVEKETAEEFFQLVDDPDLQMIKPSYDLAGNSVPLRMLRVYQDGAGQEDIRGTAWGLVNGVTRYLDHETNARSADNRIQRSWFGNGRNIKARAVDLAVAITEQRWDDVVGDRRQQAKSSKGKGNARNRRLESV